MSAFAIPGSSSDDKSGESSDDVCDPGKKQEFEAMEADILRFGRAEKTTEFGTTVFTGEVSEKVRDEVLWWSGAFISTCTV